MSDHRAAAIVYTRMKYIGFPQGMMIQPEDFTREDEIKIQGYIRDAMHNDIELRSAHLKSRIIIADKKHVILGAVCFLRDIVKDAWSTKDEGKREIHGFIGYVWRREEFSAEVGFPTDDSFLEVLKKWLLPHWEEPNHAKWAQFPHLSAYDHDVERKSPVLPDGKEAGSPVFPPASRTQWVFSPDTEEAALVWALEQTARGTDISLCTNLYVYSEEDRQNRFQYAVAMNHAQQAQFLRQDKPREALQDNDPNEKSAHTDIESQLAAAMKSGKETHDGEKERELSLAAVLGAAALLIAAAVLGLRGVFQTKPEVQETVQEAAVKSNIPWIPVIVLLALALFAFGAVLWYRHRNQAKGKNSFPTAPKQPLPPLKTPTSPKPAPVSPSSTVPKQKKETIDEIFKL